MMRVYSSVLAELQQLIVIRNYVSTVSESITLEKSLAYKLKSSLREYDKKIVKIISTEDFQKYLTTEALDSTCILQSVKDKMLADEAAAELLKEEYVKEHSSSKEDFEKSCELVKAQDVVLPVVRPDIEKSCELVKNRDVVLPVVAPVAVTVVESKEVIDNRITQHMDKEDLVTEEQLKRVYEAASKAPAVKQAAVKPAIKSPGRPKKVEPSKDLTDDEIEKLGGISRTGSVGANTKPTILNSNVKKKNGFRRVE